MEYEVTMLRDGEPVREHSPDDAFYYVEVTDTFSGEANYCWVRRYKVRANTARGAICKVSRHECLSFRGVGAGRYDAVGACICAFVDPFDSECHYGRVL